MSSEVGFDILTSIWLNNIEMARLVFFTKTTNSSNSKILAMRVINKK